MLPGFRFLFAAILLSMSVLIFGLGAAALLRAAHEEVASIPARRATPEPVFAQQNEPALSTLALLRVEPPVVEKPAEGVTAAETPTEQVPDTTPPTEPEKLAALKPEEPALPETAKPETPVPEAAPTEPAAPTEAAKPAETPVAEAAPTAQAAPDQAPAPASEPKLAAVADVPPPASRPAPTTPEQAPAPAATEQAQAQVMPETSPAATQIATLGGPAVTIEKPASAKTSGAKPDSSDIKKRARAQRAKQHRRMAQRARRAAVQQPADPFGLQPTITPAARQIRSGSAGRERRPVRQAPFGP
jgi:hypothetical protein